jgi:hypothetical protein
MIGWLRGSSARLLERLRSLLKHPTHGSQGQAKVPSHLGGGDACHKGRPASISRPRDLAHGRSPPCAGESRRLVTPDRIVLGGMSAVAADPAVPKEVEAEIRTESHSGSQCPDALLRSRELLEALQGGRDLRISTYVPHGGKSLSDLCAAFR